MNDLQKIKACFTSHGALWRSISGIARESGLSQERIAFIILKNIDDFEIEVNKAGTILIQLLIT